MPVRRAWAPPPGGCPRIGVLAPTGGGGAPATITTRSPALNRPSERMAGSPWRTIASVESTLSTRNVSTPQVIASWLRTAGSGVKASSGSRVCSRASRRTVSPDWENATSARAESRSPMSRAA